MSRIKDIFAYTGGLNSDDEDRNIPKGDVRDALNIRSSSSDTDNVGASTNIKSHLELTNNVLPAGVNTPVGYSENVEDDSVFLFYHNDGGEHSIVEYSRKKKLFQLVAKGSYLNFDKDVLINHSNVIGDFLTWTTNDGNPPRKLNYQKAKLFISSGGSSPDGYSVMNDELVTAIKRPPVSAPLNVAYRRDKDRVKNDLNNKAFQFSYSYVYDDFEVSTVSPYSIIALPFSVEPSSEDSVDDPDFVFFTYNNNVVRFDLDTGPEYVRAILVFAREGNTGDWFRVDKLEKYKNDGTVLIASNTTYEFSFYNDQIRNTVDQLDFARPFDYVPIEASCQEYVSPGHLVYADYLEGYDPVDVDMDLTVENEAVTPAGTTAPAFNFQRQSANKFYVGVPVDGTFTKPDESLEDDVIVRIENSVEGIDFFYNFTFEDTIGTVFDLRARIIKEMVREGINAIPFGGTDYTIEINTTTSDADIDWVVTDSIGYTNVVPHFKSGANHFFGIVYYDEAKRSGAVNANSDSFVYVPFLTENKPFNGGANTLFRNQVKIDIKHQPPAWAKTYQVVYSGNTDIKRSIWKVIDNLDTTDPEEFTFTITHIDGTFRSYIFEEGDRLVFTLKPGGAYFGTFLNLKIKSYDLGTQTITVDAWDMAAHTVGNGDIIEIYTPKLKTEETIYREWGEQYEIGNPGETNRYHKGLDQDQDPLDLAGTPAIVLMRYGDFYKRVDKIFTYMDESDSFFKREDLIGNNQGRPNIQAPLLKQRRFKAGLRYGGKFFLDSQTNNLFKFEFQDEKSLSEKWGSITRIIEVGFTLKVLQHYKNTSIYVGRTQTLDASNQQNLALSSNLLGSAQPSEDDYGCKNPESVRKYDRHIYFFDVRNGVVVRDSANGMIPISSAKMVSYFRDKANEIESEFGEVFVLGNIDKDYGEYVLSFVKKPGFPEANITEETIMFDAIQNRWKTKYHYLPQLTGNIGDLSFMLISDKFYLLNQGNDFNVLGGVSGDSELEVVFNIHPQKIKVHDSIAINSNRNVSCPSITIPSDQINRSTERLSRLIASKFEQKEGVWYSEFLKDMNTDNFATQLLALINGEELRGQTIKIKMVYSNNDELVINSVIVHSTPSELSM